METVLTKAQAKKIDSYRVCENGKDYQYRLDDGFCRLIRNRVDILKGKNAISCHSYHCGSYSYQGVDRFWHFMDGDIDVLKDKKALYCYLGRKRTVKFSDGGVWRSIKMSKIKPKAVIFDIDVVLAEKSPGRGYGEYDKVDLDKPVKETLRLLNYYANKLDHPEILFITSRKEYCRAMTIDWLVFQSNKNDVTYTEDFDILGQGLSSYHFDNLFMRGDTDHRKAEILKKEIYDTHIKEKYDVVAVFEDDPEVAQMYKKEGLFVFQVLR